jgi:hypothetical protein
MLFQNCALKRIHFFVGVQSTHDGSLSPQSDLSVEDPQNVLPASCHLTQVAILNVGRVYVERRI